MWNVVYLLYNKYWTLAWFIRPHTHTWLLVKLKFPRFLRSLSLLLVSVPTQNSKIQNIINTFIKKKNQMKNIFEYRFYNTIHAQSNSNIFLFPTKLSKVIECIFPTCRSLTKVFTYCQKWDLSRDLYNYFIRYLSSSIKYLALII